MNRLCECKKAGYCTRHKMEKDAIQFLACKGEGPHVDCGRKFWRAWECGRLGATAPEDPQPDIEWECGGITHNTPRNARTHPARIHTASKVGDALSTQFSALGIKPIKGCSCKQVHNQLNAQSPQSILANINHWAVVVRNSARKWQELKGGAWSIVPTPPLALFRKLLQDAAQKELNECSGHTE